MLDRTATRIVVAAAEGYSTRTETFEGREHLVVPVVALVEGVVHAMNSANPELVTAEEYSYAPGGWNGRPVFLGHPERGGEPVSGNTPAVLEEERIGIVFNAGIRKKKLAMEAWIDVERAEKIAPELLKRLNDKKPIEISVGVYVDTDETEGEFNGKKYAGSWHDIVPDHLALLPSDEEGACSNDMGCGVRAAKGSVMAEDLTRRTLRERFMDMFRLAQSADEMSSNDLTRKLYEALRPVEANLSYVEGFIPVTDPTDVVYSCWFPTTDASGMGYQSKMYRRSFQLNDAGVVTLDAARTEVEPVVRYEPVAGELATAAAATEPAPKNAAAGTPCSCKDHVVPSNLSKGESVMTKTERVKALIAKAKSYFTDADQAFLEAASDEQLARFEAASDAPAPAAAAETPAAPAVQPAAAQPAAAAAPAAETPTTAAAAPKPATLEDLIAASDQDVRESFAEQKRLSAEKRANTIAALKKTGRCQYSDEELKAMGQKDLDRMLALAGGPKEQVDFGGQGGPKDLSAGSNSAPEPPSLDDALKTRK